MSSERFPLSSPERIVSVVQPEADCVHGSENFFSEAQRTVSASIRAHQRLLEDGVAMSQIASVARILTSAFLRGRKVMLFGNGGSAADAQHIAAEFVGRFAIERAALPVMALSVNTSCVTAIGNDYGFERVFARQIEAFGGEGDVAIGISTSGNSLNVLNGLGTARQIGMPTVAMTGASGGTIREKADVCICAPSEDTPRIQECHILIGHVISELVERAIFHGASGLS
jgi:D-sedoheptulose 7-phosphate isomerase